MIPFFSVVLSDGRSVPGHRAVEVTAGTHGGVHEIRLHTAPGPQPSGQSTIDFISDYNYIYWCSFCPLFIILVSVKYFVFCQM